MIIIVHKGSEEIGGTCISLTEAGTTILLDLGLPLKKESKVVDVSKLYPRPDAVFLSHPHLDHYGLIKELDKKIPVYIGKVGHLLINALSDFTKQERPENNFQYISGFKKIEFGPFQIMPRPVDHSAAEAFAFEVRAGGQTFFYSGDLRAHGRKPKTFENLLKKPPRKVDLMFLEGTMISRPDEKIKSEPELEQEFVKVMKNQTNISFVICSSQNIDRLVTVYRACKRTGKTMVIDIYTAWVLEQFIKNDPNTHVPNLSKFKDLEVLLERNQLKKLEADPDKFGYFAELAVSRPAFKDKKKRPLADYVVVGRTNAFTFTLINKFKKWSKVDVIYSMWMGYIKEADQLEKPNFRRMAEYQRDPKVNFRYVHTSGHAGVKDLQKLVTAIKPAKLHPIHTEFPKKYKDIFQGVDVIDTEDEKVIIFLKTLSEKDTTILLDKIIKILFKIDPMSLVHMAVSSGFLQPSETLEVMGHEYRLEAMDILSRFDNWKSAKNLEKIIKEVFHRWFYLKNNDDVCPEFYAKAAQEIWNEKLEIEGKPKLTFSDLKMPEKFNPITIKIN